MVRRFVYAGVLLVLLLLPASSRCDTFGPKKDGSECAVCDNDSDCNPGSRCALFVVDGGFLDGTPTQRCALPRTRTCDD